MFGIQRPQLKVLEVCFRSHIFNQRMPIAFLLPDHIAFYVNSVEWVFFKKWAPCSSPICFQMFYSVFVSHQNSSVTSHMFTYQRLVCFPMKRPWLAVFLLCASQLFMSPLSKSGWKRHTTGVVIFNIFFFQLRIKTVALQCLIWVCGLNQ